MEPKVSLIAKVHSMDIDSKIKSIAEGIRTYGSIAILGAGISLEQGFPLTSHLQMLLWNALDSDECARKELAAKLGQKVSPTKKLIGDDPYKTKIALDILSSSPIARKTFQYSFKKLNDDKIKNPSITHDIISELLHRRTIEMIISLNWDTLLETAYHQHYGSNLYPNGNWLKKPHGDAANPDLKWVLPNEVSNLPDVIIQEISSLAEEYPRVLLIVGYSEKDEEIVSKIIKPLSDQWQIVRIGPHATDKHDIPLTAEQTLLKLHESICSSPEVPGCEYINFDNQHDLGNALMGRGLSPSDVNACPRLPEVDIAKQQLEVTGSSVIVGKMGSGKSLIAYQTAYDLNKDGWEILRLNNIAQSKEQLIVRLLDLPCKSLLIIDNAQSLDENVVSYILENASSGKLRILIVTTEDNTSRYDKINVVGERAVSFIAKDFKNRQKELLPIIQELDKTIGEGYLDISLESRINEAKKSSKTPWQFNFVLTGGWHRATNELSIIHEMGRADLLLAAISLKQIVSLDIGSSLEWLENASKILGKDKSWMNQALKTLKDRHLILDENIIRCPHVRFSQVVIDIIYNNSRDECHEQLINLSRIILNEELPSLKGVYWALNSWSLCRNPSNLFKSIINSQVLAAIMKRCWAASTNEDIGYASRVLSVLDTWYLKEVDYFISNSKIIAKWIEEADANSAYGLGHLINGLGQKDHKLTEDIIDQVDPQIVANKLTQIDISDAYVWGYFLGRLAYASSGDWRKCLKNSLDPPALSPLFSNIKSEIDDIISISNLALGISDFDHLLGIRLVELCIPVIAEAINHDVIKFHDIFELISFVLGFAPDFLKQDEPSQKQKPVAHKLAEAINAESVAQFISKSNRRDWKEYAQLIYFLKEVMPDKASEIIHLVDLNALNETSKDLWKYPPYELIYIITALAGEDDCEPARSWINQHVNELNMLDPRLVIITPESTIPLLKKGCKLDLKLGELSEWGLATLTIQSISTIDKKVASMVLETNKEGIVQGLEFKRHNYYYKDFPEFIDMIKDLAPNILKECLESLDPVTIKSSWAERLKGDKKEQQAVETLINLITNKNITSLMNVAHELKGIDP